jgi:hypothetical protein
MLAEPLANDFTTPPDALPPKAPPTSPTCGATVVLLIVLSFPIIVVSVLLNVST